MKVSITILLSCIANCFLYLNSRLLVFKKHFRELIGFILIAGYLFYSHAERHGYEKTFIDSEKYFLFLGIVIINVFTFPILNNFNNSIKLLYQFYEVKLFNYIEKNLPTPIRYIINIFYFIISMGAIGVIFFFQMLWILALPVMIWSYLYVNLLMTKLLKIFPADYYFIEYSFKGFS